MKPVVVLCVLCLAVAAQAGQKQTDADRAAALVVRWQQIVYPKFENARAFIAEEQSDALNAFLSGGAVRAVRDRLDARGLQKADAAIDAFAGSMIRNGDRRPDGSYILTATSYEKALDASCPLYPFCDR